MYFPRVISCALICGLGLGGCGLSNPKISEAWDTGYPEVPADPKHHKLAEPPLLPTTLIEFEIKKRIYCELKDAVRQSLMYPIDYRNTPTGPITHSDPLIPEGWTAQIQISLQVDESTALNPGLTLSEVMPNAAKTFGVGNTVTTPQSFSLGFGGTLSSTATRTDKFNPQYTIEYLAKDPTPDSVCNPGKDDFQQLPNGVPHSSPFLIESDLGIRDWLIGAMVVNRYIPSQVFPPQKPAPSGDDSCQKLIQALCKALGTCDKIGKDNSCKGKEGKAGAELAAMAAAAPSDTGAGGGGAIKPDTISYEIKFVIVSSGNVTPTWKLLRLSANTGASPFLGANRTRTHDLIITIGPPAQAASVHFANTLGAAVGDNRTVATPAGQ